MMRKCGPDRTSGRDKVALREIERRCPSNPRIARDSEKSEDEDKIRQACTGVGGNQERQDDAGERQHDIRCTDDPGLKPAAEIPGGQAEDDAEKGREQGSGKCNR